jgi:hypothetical protein
MKLWHLMIILHALSGFISFGAGTLALSPRRAKRYAWSLPAYYISLITLVIFMIGAMASHWSEMSQAEQIIFPGLTVLGLYMVYRADHARRLLTNKTYNAPIYMNDVGFTLISLFNGFVIVGAIDLGWPFWVVVLGAIVATLVGNQIIEAAKKREAVS